MATIRNRSNFDNQQERAGHKWEERDEKALEFFFKIKDNPTPGTFKMGRWYGMQIRKVQRDLFSDMEEANSGNFIIPSLPANITELDLHAFSFAVNHILSDQSYQSGNVETHSGLSKTKALMNINGNAERTNYYGGEILQSLNEICKMGYGVDKPSSKQRKSMALLLDFLDKNEFHLNLPDGYEYISKICVTMGKFKKDNEPIYYHLWLNPLFCENVRRNFAQFPKDITRKLHEATKEKTPTHYKLISLIGNQDKRKPFVRNIETLLEDLDLMKEYKKDAKKTELKLISHFDAMQNINLIDRYEYKETIRRNKKRISKVIFYFPE